MLYTSRLRPSSGTDVYPHSLADPPPPHAARIHKQRISSVAFTSANPYGNVQMRVGVARALADSSDFGFLGEQSSQNGRFPALDADKPPCKI